MKARLGWSLVLGATLTALVPASASAKPARPDLTVTRVAPKAATLPSDRRLAVAVTVKNNGPKKAKKSAVALSLSTDRKAGADTAVGRARSVKALKRRKRAALTATASVAATVAPGAYFVVACADPRKRIKERNERNNCRVSASAVAVPAPFGGLNPPPIAEPAPTPAPSPSPSPTPSPTPTPPPPGPPVIVHVSPADGEGGVSPGREVAIDFSAPLTEASVDPADFELSVAGEPVVADLVHSADRTTVTLFPEDRFPGSARVRLRVDGSGLVADDGKSVDGDLDGQEGGPARTSFDTASVTGLPGTEVCGTVKAAEQSSGADVPLPAVTITVDGAEQTLKAETDGAGDFCLDPAPGGAFFVHIDGRTTTAPHPPGAYYPFVGKRWESVPGQTTDIGDIFLPLVPADALTPVSPVTDTEVHLPPSELATQPELAGVQVTVPADSLYSEDGSRGGKVGLALVPPERLPSPLPEGANPPVVITVQSDLGTNFDEPAPACFPNLAPPGGTAPSPGEKSALVSFDHDKGDWVVAGSGTVSADGTLICTDPGVGIREPGWHWFLPLLGLEGGGGVPDDPNSCDEEQALSNWQDSMTDLFTGSNTRQLQRNKLPDDASWSRLQAFGPRLVSGTDAERDQAANELIIELSDQLKRMARVPAAVTGLDKIADARKTTEELVVERRDCFVKLATFVLQGGQTEQDLQRDLGSAAGTLIGQVTGSGDFGEVSDEDAGEADDILDGGTEAATPASPGGEEVTPTERAEVQALPKPDNIDAAEVDQFLDILNEFVFPSPPDPVIAADIAGAIDGLGPPLEEARERHWPHVLHGLDLVLGDIGLTSDAAWAPLAPAARRQHYRITDMVTGFERRGRTDPQGAIPLLLLQPDRLHKIEYLDPLTLHIGLTFHTTGAAGATEQIPKTGFVAPPAADQDGDGLSDIGEQIVGTDADDADSDDDGVRDGPEVRNDTDPLDGRPAATGVIGSTALPGSAKAVEAFGDLAAVASGAAGVALLDVANRAAPIRVGQVAVAGSASGVALAGDRLAVATGPDGLAIADVSDPAAPVLTGQFTLGSPVRRVAAGPDVAYTALDNRRVRVVDIESGDVLDELLLPDAIHDVALAGDELYVVTFSKLHVFADFGHGLAELGSVDLPGSSTQERLRSLHVGGGLAYVGIPFGAMPGYRVVDVSDPSDPVVVGGPGAPQGGFFDLAVNGSGLLLAATAVSPSDAVAGVYDSSDPTDVDELLGTFDTPGSAEGVSIFAGLGYVVDDTAGLQVLNYRAYDSAGQAPAITLDVPATAEEEKFLLLHADVTDDVQVREVEFFVGGERVAVDGSFPFEHRVRTPSLATQPSLTVRARAVDTGGNAAATTDQTVTMVADATPPTVKRLAPAGRSFTPGSNVTVSAVFSEPVDPATLAGRLRVFEPDGDEVTGGTIDYRESSHAALLTFPNAFTDPGTYRIVLEAGVEDLKGNALAAGAESTFRISLADIGPGEHADFSGSITVAEPSDAYALAFDAGQRIYFDVTSLGAGCGFTELRWTLLDPDGVAVFSNESLDLCADRGRVTMPKAGTYTLTVFAENGGSGDYAFSVWDIPPDDVTAVNVGDTLAGELEGPGRADRWTFTATDGDRIFLDTIALGAGCGFNDLQVRLMRPNGTQLLTYDPDLCDDRGPVTLDATGTWTVIVDADPDRDDTGTYEIVLAGVPADDVTAVDVGDTLDGELEGPGRADRWTFTAATGDRIFLDTIALGVGCGFNDLRVRLLRPDGTQLLTYDPDLCGDRGPITLDATGTWTIVVDAHPDRDDTGTYEIVLAGVPGDDVTAVDVGDTLDGELEGPGRADRWTFTAATGDRIFLDTIALGVGCGFNDLRVRLLRPDGTQLLTYDPDLCGDRGPITLDATGTWTIVVDAHPDRDDSGTYEIVLRSVPAPQSFTIAIGDTISPGVPGPGAGNVEVPGAEDRYSFAGTAGQSVRFDVQQVNGNCSSATGVGLTLLAPDDTPLFSNHGIGFCADRAPLSLTQTGTHVLRVGALNNDDTATYTIAVSPNPRPARRAVRRAAPDDAGVAVVRRWQTAVATATARRSLTPPRAARAYAVLSVAMERALRGVDGARAQRAAVAAAGRDVMTALFTDEAERWARMASAAGAPPVPSAAAAPVLARAAKDGSAIAKLPRIPVLRPGRWQPTPPMQAWPSDPGAARWKPWNLESGAAIDVPAPPEPGSAAQARDMREIYAMSKRLTAGDRRLALGWEARRGTKTPAGIWNDIALRMLARREAGAHTAARVLAALNTAQADAMISAWYVKYRWWSERPVTFIRREIDRNWKPLLRTPNFPGYVSGHSTASAASAEVLGAVFPERASRLRRMAANAGRSRLVGGIHVRADDEAGSRLGRAAGRAAVRRRLHAAR